ncbi:hypothetical protein [Mesorhizobium sp.]|uniref:hypothetical protein n=1 Tax=Mesorhizobium sp. TaxID=1871066 RepID=UPI000FE2F408|nr:hypothetical protein [Mesorhizobium sp.]RWB95592.1 MAG: hypothetical protein EOQ56_27990 [Mesorhizobium sp.]RWI35528.1 MAG: hypothetical protein EOR14_28925 [Mesorhizobium sp.]RWJ03464.1 MAG: hypothetical protein EOR24_32305 [Mesorhizobium sp.]RWJ66303.1 MAG: hypothetical protein EOR34_28210 [Mesorhizobium sp.]
MSAIDFPAGKKAPGEGRNGYYDAVGIGVLKVGDNVRIENLHSRGYARGFVGLPYDSDVLRALARELNALAERRETE